MGKEVDDLNNSEYQVRLQNISNSKVPYFSLEESSILLQIIKKLHCKVKTWREDMCLFGEAQSRVLVSVSLQNEEALLSYLEAQHFPLQKIG